MRQVLILIFFFALGARVTMEEKSQLWFACSPFIQVSFLFKQGEGRETKRKNRRNQGMETITSPTCLWVVRKNLTSIMKVLLVGFCGL